MIPSLSLYPPAPLPYLRSLSNNFKKSIKTIICFQYITFFVLIIVELDFLKTISSAQVKEGPISL